jgi:hypothetical protein
MTMKINIQRWERAGRIIVGLVLISFVFWGPHSNWFWLGLIPLMTGFVGVCPLYSVCRMNTSSRNPAKK